jgi:predicted transcriptional regulator
MSDDSQLLKAILSTVARQAFPPEKLLEIVAPKASSERQIAAYNLCDGEHTQTEIAATVKIDKANLNKSISKWIELGVMFRIRNGTEMRPMHLYPLPAASKKKSN